MEVLLQDEIFDILHEYHINVSVGKSWHKKKTEKNNNTNNKNNNNKKRDMSSPKT